MKYTLPPSYFISLKFIKYCLIITIMDWIRKILGEKKFHERLLKSKRFTILCIDTLAERLVIKDELNEKVFQVTLIKYIGESTGLYCITCGRHNCDHVIVSFYSHEVAKLKSYMSVTNAGYQNMFLYLPESIRICVERTNVFKLLIFNIIPAILLTIISPDLLPFFIIPDSDWQVEGLTNTINT